MTAAERQLAFLSEDAVAYAPRLFALYGVYNRPLLPDMEPGVFLGWGMEFPLPSKAILLLPEGTTWHSDSAESLITRYQSVADARLVWLTDDPGDDDPSADDYDLAGR